VSNPERDRFPEAESSEPGLNGPLASGAVPRGATESTAQRGAAARALTELDAPSFSRKQAGSAPELDSIEPAYASHDSIPPLPAADASIEPPANPLVVSETRALSEADTQSPSEASAAESDRALERRIVSLTEAAIPDSDAVALTEGSEPARTQGITAEPDVATRALTHVPSEQWFDATLSIPGTTGLALDVRQRLAWRFKAAFAAWKLLVPICQTPEARAELVSAMRSYEKLLRSTGRAAGETNQPLSDAVHAQLSESQTLECDRALTELESALLAVDESLNDETFKAHFSRQREQPKALLRYARFLGARRFGIGYRRDRFETLALELLSARLPSGRLLLMPRKRAGQVLEQLLRGLHRPPVSAEDQGSALSYLRDALDRLENLAGSKQFFDSGFFLDVYGYKISMHDRITSPEFLYLCVALDVEVHNRLQAWSAQASGTGKALGGPLTALHVQLRAQQEAAQAVFSDFHRPLVGHAAATAARAAAPAKKPPKRAEAAQPAVSDESSLWRVAAAAAFALAALGANLYALDYLHWNEPPRPLADTELKQLSPLLLNGQLTQDGKRFSGLLARPEWRRLSPHERVAEAARLATALKQRGIDHAEVLAYKARAMQIDYGTVVYVDDAK
jgi:hypothetical protein